MMPHPGQLWSEPSSFLSRVRHHASLPGLVAFWLVLAVLALLQNYLSAVLQGNRINWSDLLLFKLYWLLFIPYSIFWMRVMKAMGSRFHAINIFVLTLAVTLVTGVLHLFTFLGLLYVLSRAFHADPYEFSWLLSTKMANHLVWSIVAFVCFALVYAWRETTLRKSEPISVIKVRIGQRSVMVKVADIQWIKSDGPYLNIHTSDQRYLIGETLKGMMEKLPLGFRRIHRSTIVNTDVISELRSRLNGDYDVVLNDGTELRLSRSFAKDLKQSMQ